MFRHILGLINSSVRTLRSVPDSEHVQVVNSSNLVIATIIIMIVLTIVHAFHEKLSILYNI